MDGRNVRSTASPSASSQTWPVDPTQDISDDEWLGFVVRPDSAPLARVEAFCGLGRTFFLVTPPPAIPTPARSSTPNAETWPIDPALDLSYEELFGIVDHVDRTPRGRMEVLTDRGRSYAVLTGWRSFPPMATPLSPVTVAVSAPSRAASVDASQPVSRSDRAQAVNSTPVPTQAVAEHDVDEDRFYTTREAAEYLRYAGDSGLRRAKALGHIKPDETGPRGVALYRRATLDAYEAQRHRGNRSRTAPATEPSAVPPSGDSLAVTSLLQSPEIETSTRGVSTEDVAPAAPPREIVQPPSVSDATVYDRSPRDDARRTTSRVADVKGVLPLLSRSDGLLDVAPPVAPATSRAWTPRCLTGGPPRAAARCRAAHDPVGGAPTID